MHNIVPIISLFTLTISYHDQRSQFQETPRKSKSNLQNAINKGNEMSKLWNKKEKFGKQRAAAAQKIPSVSHSCKISAARI